MQAGLSQGSMSHLGAVGSQVTDMKYQIRTDGNILQTKDDEMDLEEIMDVSGTHEIRLAAGGNSSLQDVKVEASTTTPQELPGSRMDRGLPFRQASPQKTQQRLVHGDYEGDLLNQFVRFCLLVLS